MPILRYTLATIKSYKSTDDDFEYNYDIINYPIINYDIGQDKEKIEQGIFILHTDIDFNNEKQVFEAHEDWAGGGNTRHIILGYYRDNNQYYINYIKDSHTRQRFDYTPPLEYPTNAPRPNGGTSDAGIEQFNPAQSTHTESVHVSVAESIKCLHSRYKNIDENKTIESIKEFIQNIPKDLDVNEEKRLYAVEGFDTLTKIFENKEAITGHTIKHILALIWNGLEDADPTISLANKKTLKEAFINYFNEFLRGYNIDSSGKDQGGENMPVCSGGIINKLVGILEGGRHKDVEIIYITSETAGVKLSSLVKEHVIQYLKVHKDKNKLLNGFSKDGESWLIPEVIQSELNEEIKQAFFAEFKDNLKLNVLEDIFTAYDCVTFSEQEFLELKRSLENEHDSVNSNNSIEKKHNGANLNSRTITIKELVMVFGITLSLVAISTFIAASLGVTSGFILIGMGVAVGVLSAIMLSTIFMGVTKHFSDSPASEVEVNAQEDTEQSHVSSFKEILSFFGINKSSSQSDVDSSIGKSEQATNSSANSTLPTEKSDDNDSLAPSFTPRS